MVIKDLLLKGTDILKTCESPRMEAEILLSHVLGKDRLYLVVHKEDDVSKKDAQSFLSLCKERESGKPYAYIAGEKEFMSLKFLVDESVLIPRPDTEITVQAIIDKYNGKKVNIIDICTGSGAIGCSLAHFIKTSTVCATDISDDALKLAQKNAEHLGVSDRVTFIKEDALCMSERKVKFDVAVSNPPYICSSVIETLDKDVRDFEPRLALDGGCDGLIFYRKIVDNIEKVLKEKGELYFEIGFDQKDAVVEIMEKKFENIASVKDLGGNDRLIFGQLR